MSIPSQSQSSPIVHFTNSIRSDGNPCSAIGGSPDPLLIEGDSQQHRTELFDRPQSTPIRSKSSRDRSTTDENSFTLNSIRKRQRFLTTLTDVTPLHRIENEISSDLCSTEENEDRFCLRPPPLLVLSQSIQSKHPEQLNETTLNHRFSSKKDLPNAPANYSLVFYQFNSTELEEARRLTRRMGTCFTSETIDFVTTHVLLPDDNPNRSMTLDLILALIYGCRLVTFEWLKCSSRIGEWLGVSRFEPKNLYLRNSSLNIYRKYRQRTKSIEIFHQSGWIYLTSTVEQRSLLVKLITFLGGDITVSRDRAHIIVGKSSKDLCVITYPQVHPQWVTDSIYAGKALSTDLYLIH